MINVSLRRPLNAIERNLCSKMNYNLKKRFFIQLTDFQPSRLGVEQISRIKNEIINK